ncbi:MAG: DUF4908 domain-containing protein [Pseudomonadota bacterium]
MRAVAWILASLLGAGVLNVAAAQTSVSREPVAAHRSVTPSPVMQAPMTRAMMEMTVKGRTQEANPFSALVGQQRMRRSGRDDRGRVERFVLASDDRAFLVESRTRTARVKFLCGPEDKRLDCRLDPEGPAPEIYLLSVTRGPRGDRIFKTAEGDTYLRLASYGGATVFWPGEGVGHGASKSFGEDSALRLVFTDLETARRRAKSATAVISAATGAPIIFDLMTEPLEPGSDASVVADAIIRAAIALDRVAGDPTGARILASRIDRVAFQEATVSAVRFEGKTLHVDYVPDQDIAGRPSSRSIEQFLEESL